MERAERVLSRDKLVTWRMMETEVQRRKEENRAALRAHLGGSNPPT